MGALAALVPALASLRPMLLVAGALALSVATELGIALLVAGVVSAGVGLLATIRSGRPAKRRRRLRRTDTRDGELGVAGRRSG